MSNTATLSMQTCIKSARYSAGYANRDIASTAAAFSPETIGRHERGQAQIDAQAAIVYATAYNAPRLLDIYCADCPIGRAKGKRVATVDIPLALLRILRQLRGIPNAVERLEEIVDDGLIDAKERPDCEKIFAILREFVQTIEDLIFSAQQNEPSPLQRRTARDKRSAFDRKDLG